MGGEHGHEGDGGCECVGLTMRGKQWLVFDNLNDAHETRRQIAEKLYFPPTLVFTTTKDVAIPSISYLNEDLPSNVKIQTLTNNYAAHNNDQLLLRMSHLYQVGEHSSLSKPVDVDLEKVFGKTGLKIASATEVSLTANQLVEEMDAKKHQWKTSPLNERVEQNLHDAKVKRAGFDSRSVQLSCCDHASDGSSNLSREIRLIVCVCVCVCVQCLVLFFGNYIRTK